MSDRIMTEDMGHIHRVNVSISMHLDFIGSVKREVPTIVSVPQSVWMLSKKNKKNSNFPHDMMDIVGIFHSRKQKNESKMEKNTLSVSRYQRQKKSFSMTLFVVVLSSTQVR